MTHDDLLKKVETDQEITEYLNKGLINGDITVNTARQHWFQSNALRAVVELHKPVISQQVKDTYPNDQKRMESEPKVCKECSDIWEMDLGVLYPCPTIQAIEEQLK